MTTGMTDATGRVESVNISTEKGTIKHPVPAITIAGHGIESDGHAGPGLRQVSLLAAESIERFGAQMNRTFRPGEFAENLTVRGFDLLDTALLDRFRIGSVELEVTAIGKTCHGGDCAVFREVGKCVMPKEGIFCRVIAGGTVQPGDAIESHPRCMRITILTLSDRASQSVYADKSGPRLQALLEQFGAERRWRVLVESAVLPDDAAKLEQALVRARDDAVDVVFTTGGTGIGPRDITPDVVARLADKTVPGIMEAIRAKYGPAHPNALLSRSVAAVLGTTLVYTLPGSVRAVEEYLAEILKTLEHALYMLRGLDAH